MIKFGWKGIFLVFLVYALMEEAFDEEVGAISAVITLAVLVAIPIMEKRRAAEGKPGNYAERRRQGKMDQVDRLYREYASVIDEYHKTPLPMFSQVLGKEKSRVVSDLNILISCGRFQRAHIEFDEDAFVVDEYLKERNPENKNPGEESGRRNAAETSGDDVLENQRSQTVEIIEEAAQHVQDEEMRAVLNEIEESTAEILDRMKNTPEKTGEDVRKFQKFYLPKAMECIRNYDILIQRTHLSEQELSARYDLESAIKTICHSFRKLRDSFSANEAVDMAAEAKAVQSMLENDGLADMFPEMKIRNLGDESAAGREENGNRIIS